MKQKWIPVSDRLPKPEGCKQYLVTVAHFNPELKYRHVAMADYEARMDDEPPFWCEYTERDGVRVVAWMPLPKPYGCDFKSERKS